MPSSLRFLVTGATGFLGNNLVVALLKSGHRVRVLVREAADSRPLESLDVEIVHGDVRDAVSVDRACEDIDVVVHAASVVRIGWSLSGGMREINVGGTSNMVAAARQRGCKLIYVSTVNALAVSGSDRPADESTLLSGAEIPCNYVATKRESTELVRAAIAEGVDATIVYPGMMLGPRDWKPSSGQMLLAVARTFTPLAPNGGISISHVDDVVAAIHTIAQRDELSDSCHREFILAGHNLTYFDLWNLMADVAGARGPVMRMGNLLASCVSLAADGWSKVSRDEPLVNSAAIRMGQQFHYYDSSRAVEELGYQVSELKPTIQAAWDWLQQHHG